jgi:mono/diheme cytochrome c family protein
LTLVKERGRLRVIRNLTGATALLVLGFALPGGSPASAQPKPGDAWEVPARAAKKKNPFPADEKSIAAGREVYVKECLACHGQKGKGDGSGATGLRKRPSNFTTEAFHAQTDGALFFKTTEGRKPMPAYRKTLTEEERWHVVNYLRTLKEKKVD